MAKQVSRSPTGFYKDVPVMITLACINQSATQAEIGRLIGYCPETMSRLASGNREYIDSMPVGKLLSLMLLAKCTFERKEA